VTAAAALWKQGYARWLASAQFPFRLPGVRASYGELVQREAAWQGVPADRVVLAPGDVETTYQEAVAIRQLAQQRGWCSLIVVTDPYHTRRARAIFRQVLAGTGIAVAMRPAPAHGYRPDAWWESPTGLRVTALEILKWVMYWVGYHRHREP
jgi:uncharacterized SAM-binding protein YcdF (DUF218 family)